MQVSGTFLEDLAALGQQLSQPQSILTEVGEQITSDMKANVPVDTGALRNSISYTINGNEMSINMLTYGLYQNYGVFPPYNTNTYHKPFTNRFGGIKQPTTNPFGIPATGYSNRLFGLPQRKFFDWAEVTGMVTDAFINPINEQF